MYRALPFTEYQIDVAVARWEKRVHSHSKTNVEKSPQALTQQRSKTCLRRERELERIVCNLAQNVSIGSCHCEPAVILRDVRVFIRL